MPEYIEIVITLGLILLGLLISLVKVETLIQAQMQRDKPSHGLKGKKKTRSSQRSRRLRQLYQRYLFR